MQYVVLAIFGTCAIVGVFRPFIGLMGLLGVTMINPGEIYPMLSSLHFERILVLVTLLGSLVRKEPLIFPKLTKRLLIFWASMFITVPFSFWPGGDFQFTLDFGRIILYHFLIANLVDTQKRFQVLLLVFAGLIGWVGGGALWGYVHGSFDPMAIRNGFERATGLSESNGNPNTIGLTMLSGLPIVVLLFGFAKYWQKFVGFLITLISIIAVLLTGSRTSFAILCILTASFVLNRRTIKFVPVFVVLAIAAWAVIPAQYKDRYGQIMDVVEGTKTDESFEAHRLAREAGLHMFLDYPLTGVGAGQFPIAAGQKYWPGPNKLWENPHNLYLQIPAELGIVGVITWLSFAVPFIGTARRLKRQFANVAYAHIPPPLRGFPRACLFSVAGLFIGGMFGHVLYRHTWYLLAGMTVALERIVSTQTALAEHTEETVDMAELVPHSA